MDAAHIEQTAQRLRGLGLLEHQIAEHCRHLQAIAQRRAATVPQPKPVKPKPKPPRQPTRLTPLQLAQLCTRLREGGPWRWSIAPPQAGVPWIGNVVMELLGKPCDGKRRDALTKDVLAQLQEAGLAYPERRPIGGASAHFTVVAAPPPPPQPAQLPRTGSALIARLWCGSACRPTTSRVPRQISRLARVWAPSVSKYLPPAERERGAALRGRPRHGTTSKASLTHQARKHAGLHGRTLIDPTRIQSAP